MRLTHRNRYKPKVTTWGVFPRPNNISQAYGGGRNIRPGQELETPEQKAAREVRRCAQLLLFAYESKLTARHMWRPHY